MGVGQGRIVFWFREAGITVDGVVAGAAQGPATAVFDLGMASRQGTTGCLK